MAEGIQIATLLNRYFCYHCNREVVVRSPELACPECDGGFLEEVPDSYEEDDSEPEDNELNMLNLLSFDHLLRRTVMNAVGEELDSPRHYSDESYDEPDGEPEDESEFHSVRTLLRNLDDHIFVRHRFRHLGDYVFGDDIDAFSAMLFNEAEIVGPPPLPKDQIKLLPMITVTREHVDKGVQCTICMEDFHIREKAKNLPCDHFYHEKCITPWLERHATCPNCRKPVKTQTKKPRSQSCPRSDLNSRSSADQRRFSESSSVSDFFSRGPFHFL